MQTDREGFCLLDSGDGNKALTPDMSQRSRVLELSARSEIKCTYEGLAFLAVSRIGDRMCNPTVSEVLHTISMSLTGTMRDRAPHTKGSDFCHPLQLLFDGAYY